MKHYGKYGETVDSVIMNDGQTSHPRGFGFTTYSDPSVVDKVMEENHAINGKQILKSGPLYISSKGIGWTSWKKRWFVLSRKSLMFYRTDPNALPQKGSEAPNPTLGGIELNNSGSVVVKQDKKLLSVLFSDGRDGRAFTLKTETLDELNEWKIALEDALTQAPSASHVMGQNGIFCNEVVDIIEASVEQSMDKLPTTSLIVGRPVLLALEDIDGSPSFLEKALSFIEEHGIKVEGILRQSADVEEVVRRVQEYEQGKNEFSSDEDAHVIGDCIKHVLREMPSSPVPASCCTALVDAYRTDRASRVDYIRDAIHETFPEPNRRLLQRTLQMMLTVAAHKAENRMSLSALAACMAPLLLRPLLAGECELKNDFQIDGDGSFQLLQAAAAANHAQAIMIILLEEYANIFDYEDSEDEEDIEDDESTDNDILQKVGYHDKMNELKSHSMGDPDRSYSGTSCGNDGDVFSEDSNDLDTDVGSNVGSDISSDVSSDVDSYAAGNNIDDNGVSFMKSVAECDIWSNLPIDQEIKDIEKSNRSNLLSQKSLESSVGALYSTITNKSVNIVPFASSAPTITYLSEPSKEALPALRNKWGRTPARKNLSVELIEYISDDESVVNRLENDKIDLQTKISKEIEGNSVLQASLDRRKEVLHEHRLALEKEVLMLQVQLQKERDLRLHLEFGLVDIQPDHFFNSACLDNKTRMDLEEIALSLKDINNLKQNISDITKQLQQDHATFCESCGQLIYRNTQENVSNVPNVQKHDNLFKHDNSIADSENLKDDVKSSTVLVNIQSFQKLPPKRSNQSSTTSSGASSSSEDRHGASKKVERWDNTKKDAPVYSEDQISPLPNTSTRRRAPKYEEGASSSTALTKLTTRLNFLKERRVQLANELQNLDPGRASGVDSHSKKNSVGHGS